MDELVTTLLTRLLAVAAIAFTAALGGAGAATAQPSSTPPAPSVPTPVPAQQDSTTYGFDQLCNDLHDALQIPGPSEIPVVGGIAGDAASAACKAGNVASHPGSAVEATKSKLWDSTFGKVTETLLAGLGDALSLSMWWVQMPNDALLSGAGDRAGEASLWGQVDSYTRQLQTWVLAFSIAISALRIGIARAHAAAEHAEETFKTLARSTVATWVAGTAILAGARMTDSLAEWIINDATDNNAQGAAEHLVDTGRFGVYSPGFIFLVTLVGILGALSMTALTILRQALLIVAVGFYPLTAAASGTAAGKQAYERLGAWIIAFLLFKPVAALVYMIAFVTADTTATDTNGQYSLDAAHRSFVALVLLCSVAFVLPALIRLVAPALSVLGSGGSGAGMAALGAGVGVALLSGGLLGGSRGAGAPAGGGAPVGPVPATGTGRTPPPQLPAGGGSPRGLPPGRSPAGVPPGAGGGGPGGVPATPGGSGPRGGPSGVPAGLASAAGQGGRSAQGVVDEATGSRPALPPPSTRRPDTPGPHSIPG